MFIIKHNYGCELWALFIQFYKTTIEIFWQKTNAFHSIHQCLLINDYYHYENVSNLRTQTAKPVGFESCSCRRKSYISIGRDFEFLFLFLNGRNRRKPEKLKINCADKLLTRNQLTNNSNNQTAYNQTHTNFSINLPIGSGTMQGQDQNEINARYFFFFLWKSNNQLLTRVQVCRWSYQ